MKDVKYCWMGLDALFTHVLLLSLSTCGRYHPGLAAAGVHHVRKALPHGRQDVPGGLVIVTHGLGLLAWRA